MKKLLEGATILNLVMLVFTLYCVILALGYGRNSRMFPLAIGIPTAVLVALSILAVWKPSILRGADVHLGDSSANEPNIDEIREAKYAPSHVAALIGWLILAAVAILLIGFRFAVPLFVLLFARFEGRANWLPAILVALFTWAFVVGYFELFMKFGMFRGVVFGDILPLY
ncbi:MAG: tripartite tricarboxylate transporter TctB family protein [Deltaproteobacteria bacterium]|nr:tripartite tricarboxylate transporter TctB family protein [Deltaproteobacteria bacterium]MBI2230667.1 tripartite tricarboxylate transporter TctB family protein [Deltaproteobacteria bacterium]